MEKNKTGAKIIVETLINHNINYIFTVPGAKIDKVLDEFNNYENSPKLIVSRHEQNAAFMAQGIGRLTNYPGVVYVTSGPGVSNLVTGLATANSESDPILAFGGNVSRPNSSKRTHQSMKNASTLEPVTKFSHEVNSADSLSEVIVNAYRIACEPKQGASFISIPMDVQFENTSRASLKKSVEPKQGYSCIENIIELKEEIIKAKLPVLLLGMRASDDKSVFSIRKMLKDIKIPVVETFQGAGIISRELEETFLGRVGQFKNQPGDMLLDEADLVITVGYDPIEYDPEVWNKVSKKKIYHIDSTKADIDAFYLPTNELIGDIPRTIDKLTELLLKDNYAISLIEEEIVKNLKSKFDNITKLFKYNENITHPLQLMWELRKLIDDKEFNLIDDNTVITVDVGSLYIWMARNFKSYEPRKLLFSNGMQTLGVALPWAISASLLNPGKKVISMSGDGGFLFSGQELDTAVREKCNITHIIWNDNSYNMVSFQQKMKYNRDTAVKLGSIDFVKYAEAFGAKGLRVNNPKELEEKLKEAISHKGVCVLEVPIDYSENEILGKMLMEDFV